MCTDYPTCSVNIIPEINQQYSLTTFTYGSGTILDYLNQFVDANIAKPTANPSNQTKTIYWGIAIPGGAVKGDYTGQNTVSAVQSPQMSIKIRKLVIFKQAKLSVLIFNH